MEVYKIINKLTNKVYIGATTRTKEIRYDEHCTSSKSGPIYSDILKYGRDKFIVETIEVIDNKSDLHSRESYWIDHYWNLLGSDMMYNSQNGVTHLYRERKPIFTDEHKLNLSKAGRGVPKSPSHRQKLSDSHRGKVLSETHKNNISESGKCWYKIDDCILVGLTDLLKYLNYKDIDLTYNQLDAAMKGRPSAKVRKIYPDIVNIQKLNRVERSKGITFESKYGGDE